MQELDTVDSNFLEQSRERPKRCVKFWDLTGDDELCEGITGDQLYVSRKIGYGNNGLQFFLWGDEKAWQNNVYKDPEIRFGAIPVGDVLGLSITFGDDPPLVPLWFEPSECMSIWNDLLSSEFVEFVFSFDRDDERFSTMSRYRMSSSDRMDLRDARNQIGSSVPDWWD